MTKNSLVRTFRNAIYEKKTDEFSNFIFLFYISHTGLSLIINIFKYVLIHQFIIARTLVIDCMDAYFTRTASVARQDGKYRKEKNHFTEPLHSTYYIIFEVGYRVNEIINFPSKLSTQSEIEKSESNWCVLTGTPLFFSFWKWNGK